VADFLGVITLWNMASLQQVGTLKGHKETLEDLVFAPDGNKLVSASLEQFRVWHAAPFTQTDAKEDR
jgi:WD40 repeat protein